MAERRKEQRPPRGRSAAIAGRADLDSPAYHALLGALKARVVEARARAEVNDSEE
jgi:hypothetical protein